MTPLVRAGGISGFEEFAGSLGLDVPAALKRVGLTMAALREPDALISYFAVMQLLERAARDSGRVDFGMRLSQRQSPSMLGPIAVLMEHVANVGEAFRLASRYIFVHSPAIRFSVDPVAGRPKEVDLRFSIEMAHAPPHSQTMELSLGIILRFLQVLGQGQLKPLRVLLPHARLSALSSYESVYGCPCAFEQPYAAVRLPAEALAHPLAHEDPVLRTLAQTYLDTRFTRPDQAFADHVRSLLREYLGAGLAAPANIASALAVTVRTLQRRLADEGTRFETLRDEARRQMFEQLMAQAHPPPLSQVAALLDYDHQSALTRSCQRWFGLSPRDFLAQAPQASAGVSNRAKKVRTA